MVKESRISALCPEGEKIRVGYYSKQGEPLFFLTSPQRMVSGLAAQTGAFTLYAVGKGKAKKLGTGGYPAGPEAGFRTPAVCTRCPSQTERAGT